MNLRRTKGPAALLALLVAGCGGAGDPADRSVGALVVCGRGPTVDGIDVSQYQATVDWAAVRTAGKRFAIARAVHWPTRDTQFDRNWREIRANGLIRGAYVYFDPRADVAAQAEVVVSAVGRLGAGDLPVTLDIEQPQPNLPTPARYAELVRDLAARIEAGTGRRPMIYTGHYYWPSYVQTTEFRDLPLWHAQYTTTQACPNIADAWSDWAFWQHSSTGRVSGISGNVDLDRFNGTYAELQLLAGVTPDAGTPAVDAGAPPVDVPSVRDAATADLVVPDRLAPDVSDAGSLPDVRDAATDTAADAPLDAPDAADVPIDAPDAAPPSAIVTPAGCACRVGAGDRSPRVPSPLAALLVGASLLPRRRRARR